MVSDFASPSSIQGDQSKLGGPEKSLFESSPGIGREERPPIAVVVHSSLTGFSFISLYLSVHKKKNSMIV